MSLKVLSVGQCSADHAGISSLLRKLGAETMRVDLHSELARAVEQHAPSLILVNRVNDADGSSGVELIQDFKKSHPHIPMMLVSNYPKAQAEAVTAGAVHGFGKSDLYKPQTLELLKKHLIS